MMSFWTEYFYDKAHIPVIAIGGIYETTGVYQTGP